MYTVTLLFLSFLCVRVSFFYLVDDTRPIANQFI